MKKFIIAFALLIGIASFNYSVEAQNINISINIGRQPAWGPVGYNYVGYYYFPDIDCYYDVNLGYFHYFDRGRWISARYLPYAYRHYDLYGLYKVVLNVNQPWRYHHTHYRDYAKYRGHRPQIVIRDSRDNRYRDSRNNRISWYHAEKSDRRATLYRNDNSNRPNNRYSNSNNRNSNNEKKNSRPEYNKNRNDRNDNNKSNNNSRENNRDNRSDRNKESNYNNSRTNSDRNKSNAKESSRPARSTSEKSNYRLVQNTEKGRSR